MIDNVYFVFLLSLNYIQAVWIIAYKQFLSLKESLILTSLLVVQGITSIWLDNTYFTLLLLFFFLAQFVFVTRKLNDWLISSLLLVFEDALILISWLPTVDLWNILLLKSVVSLKTYTTNLFFLVIAQQLLLALLFFITRYILKRLALLNSLALLPKKNRGLSIAILFCLFLSIGLQQLGVFKGYSVAYFYSTFIVIGFNIFFSWNIFLLTKYYKEKQYSILLAEMYTQEKQKIELATKFKDTYKELLTNLTADLEVNDLDHASQQLNSIIDYSDSFLTPNLYRKIALVNTPSIQGLLTNFIKKCDTASIDLSLQVSQELSSSAMNLVDFIRCFSILLDNAYDATLVSQEKSISIEIEGDPNYITITVKNTYVENPEIALQDFFQNNFSTKENHQGKGLYIFSKIVASYKKATYRISKKDSFFIIVFSIPKLKNPTV
ncbi:hypothetical protein UAW_02941 [Enterococcus haemoperoxidus ATCC BAA-382]|uniref:Sensor histidine kinase NatK-like C-terminal domain-containing protein n=1 Tax=Enterococcus haemoperoxidus ATCC BAA-382 TaxID=1158608 RepID=R2SBK7_9ENTE|nr:GHKL domain-containing protein [Enterococcus haemoperoxidus]EOH92900.1 hypothetical protein UAW_02941 [Enterococcus haemoperoxidus ATCC BAA-382]EOT61643.1 hypothetical protein I583_00625 [Enterococcus haemoperoxidus ATCC BAA-382]